MQFFVTLLVLLLVTRAGGSIATRMGQPALAGQLVAGVLVGILVGLLPQGVPVVQDLHGDPAFHAVTDLAVFFLMLAVGLELRPSELIEQPGVPLAVAIGGMALPLALGIGVGLWWLPDSPSRPAQALFLGTALAITAVPVAAKVLVDLGELKSRAGRTILSAAVLDDIASLVLLAVLTGLIRTGSWPPLEGLLWLGAKTLGFFAIAVPVGAWVVPGLGPAAHRMLGDQGGFSILVGLGLAYSVLAEALGLHFLVGAFFAGLFFNRSVVDPESYERASQGVAAVSDGFLVPIFFASIGFSVDLAALEAVPLFVLGLTALAVVSKAVGAGIPAWFAGMRAGPAAVVGVGMSARGAVELVIADAARKAGLFSKPSPVPIEVESLFSTVVIVAVSTTLIAPLGMRALLHATRSDGDGVREEATEC